MSQDENITVGDFYWQRKIRDAGSSEEFPK
jgi:hypothetical protein